ncbi:MAG TPA: hypothetical protein PK622_13050 [Saprospiraceae bacterium]|nr:hypothetical protein [Saprospiraceae bacterium]
MKKQAWYLFLLLLFFLSCKDAEWSYTSIEYFSVHVTDSLTGNNMANARCYISGAENILVYESAFGKTNSEGKYFFKLRKVDDIKAPSRGYISSITIAVINDSLYGRLNIPGFYSSNINNKHFYELKLNKPAILKLRVRDALIVKSTEINFTDSLLSGEKQLILKKHANSVLDTIMYFPIYKNSRTEVNYEWYDTLGNGISWHHFYLKTTPEDTTYYEFLF